MVLIFGRPFWRWIWSVGTYTERPPCLFKKKPCFQGSPEVGRLWKTIRLGDVGQKTLVKVTMENHHAINGKIHYFDWAIFNSYVTNYQRVLLRDIPGQVSLGLDRSRIAETWYTGRWVWDGHGFFCHESCFFRIKNMLQAEIARWCRVNSKHKFNVLGCICDIWCIVLADEAVSEWHNMAHVENVWNMWCFGVFLSAHPLSHRIHVWYIC